MMKETATQFLLCLALTSLVLSSLPAQGVTEAFKEKRSDLLATERLVHRETLQANHDIMLRKTQAALSGATQRKGP